PGGSLTVTLALWAKATAPRAAMTAVRKILRTRQRIWVLLWSVLFLRVLLRLRHQFLQYELVFWIHRIFAAPRRREWQSYALREFVQVRIRTGQVMGHVRGRPAGNFVDDFVRHGVELLVERHNPGRRANQRLIEIDRVVNETDDCH